MCLVVSMSNIELDLLHHHSHSIEAHPGVDALCGQVTHDVVRLVLDVLHEDEVPDLEEAILSTSDRPAGRSELISLVPEDLRGRPTGAGNSHLPEVVLAPPLHPSVGHPDHVDPDLGGLVVGLVDGVPEAFRIETETLGARTRRPRGWRFP